MFESKKKAKFILIEIWILNFKIRLLEISGLKLLGRNYYSFEKRVEIEQYKLVLFPGFLTSIGIYEGQNFSQLRLTHEKNEIENLFILFLIESELFSRTTDDERWSYYEGNQFNDQILKIKWFFKFNLSIIWGH